MDLMIDLKQVLEVLDAHEYIGKFSIEDDIFVTEHVHIGDVTAKISLDYETATLIEVWTRSLTNQLHFEVNHVAIFDGVFRRHIEVLVAESHEEAVKLFTEWTFETLRDCRVMIVQQYK